MASRAGPRLRQHPGDDAYLFSLDPVGSAPWKPDRASYLWRKVRQQVGLDGVRLHDLRHAVATHLLAAGVDPVTVAHRLGHSSPNVTLAVYSHLVPARDQAAAEQLDRIIDAM